MAVTVAQTITATKMANPSIQAVFLSSLGAIPVSKAIESTEAIKSILRVKSLRADQKSAKKPGASITCF